MPPCIIRTSYYLQMLKVIDCLEGFLRARTVAIGATRLSPEQASIGKGVREARKGASHAALHAALFLH